MRCAKRTRCVPAASAAPPWCWSTTRSCASTRRPRSSSPDVPLDAAEPTLLDLAFGAVQSFSRSPKKVNVNTSYMTLAIRGTEFVIRAEPGQSLLTVLEGEVLASNAQGEVPVPRRPVGGGARRARRRSPIWWRARATPCNGRSTTRRSSPPRRATRPSWPRRSGWPPPATSPARSRRSTGSPGRAGAAEQTYRAALLLAGRPRRRGPRRPRRGAGGRSRGRPRPWRCAP